jgi:hypothetical protein
MPKLGQTIEIQRTKKIGEVIEVDQNGEPVKMREIDSGDVIEVVGEAYTIVTILRRIYPIVKKIVMGLLSLLFRR